MAYLKNNWVLLGLILLVIIYEFLRPTDPTDSGIWFKRSGMGFHKDHGTGCHYLSGAGFFGKEILIPRVDKTGRHICE